LVVLEERVEATKSRTQRGPRWPSTAWISSLALSQSRLFPLHRLLRVCDDR
jgi:hypothetical protein